MEMWEEDMLEQAAKAGVPERFLTKELLRLWNIAEYYDTNSDEFLEALLAFLNNPKPEESA